MKHFMNWSAHLVFPSEMKSRGFWHIIPRKRDKQVLRLRLQNTLLSGGRHQARPPSWKLRWTLGLTTCSWLVLSLPFTFMHPMPSGSFKGLQLSVIADISSVSSFVNGSTVVVRHNATWIPLILKTTRFFQTSRLRCWMFLHTVCGSGLFFFNQTLFFLPLFILQFD